MVIASLLYFYPISSWLTTFSQRIYRFCFRPPIYAVRKKANYYNQINPHPIYISQAEFLQEFKFPQELRQDHTVPYHVLQFQRAKGQLTTHSPTSTSLQNSIKTRASSAISLSQPSGNLSPPTLWFGKFPRTNPQTLQSPSTTIKAG